MAALEKERFQKNIIRRTGKKMIKQDWDLSSVLRVFVSGFFGVQPSEVTNEFLMKVRADRVSRLKSLKLNPDAVNQNTIVREKNRLSGLI